LAGLSLTAIAHKHYAEFMMAVNQIDIMVTVSAIPGLFDIFRFEPLIDADFVMLERLLERGEGSA